VVDPTGSLLEQPRYNTMSSSWSWYNSCQICHDAKVGVQPEGFDDEGGAPWCPVVVKSQRSLLWLPRCHHYGFFYPSHPALPMVCDGSNATYALGVSKSATGFACIPA
jgi:hypothetical protein